ncbi:BTBD3-like protein [Mya arenaria]|uniref:BTBD3-like protein n=1 Tax=Mya arenaria TaxID=6604 RepID=A0ABY7DAI1_MYAAR|nr:BTBD3-like protein [Mya arenaria]
MCRVFLKKAINVENVCTILDQSLLFQEVDLQKECLNFISRKTTKVLKSASFLSLPPSTVECVLNEYYLNCSELDVYFALKAWAVNACKQRETDHTNTEMIRDEMGAKLRLPPNTSSRVERFKSANDKPWSIRNQTDGIRFTMSGPFRLIGVILYRPINEGMVAGQISVYQGSNLKIDLQQSVNFAAEQITSDVMFTEVQLDPGKTYSIDQIFTGVGTYRGIESQTSHVVNEVEIQFICLYFGRSPNGTSVDTGQICGIMIDNDN